MRELFSKIFRHQSSYHDFEAVRNVSFEVPAGQMLGIIGRNGSGKSTLLKIIAGVYRPTKGTVHVSGTLAPLIELGAGFHHELTGRENILLNGLLMGYSKREMLERQESIIEFADIGEFIDAPVKQYSSGMYMRLAFAVATEVDPQILLVDEILAVGDAGFQREMLRAHSQLPRLGQDHSAGDPHDGRRPEVLRPRPAARPGVDCDGWPPRGSYCDVQHPGQSRAD